MEVTQIIGNEIVLKNQNGEKVEIAKEVLINDSYSADHFELEVTCNMTELSDILKSAKDTIFKVQFRKKIDEKCIFEKLEKIKVADLKDVKAISKSIIEGAQVCMIAHLV